MRMVESGVFQGQSTRTYRLVDGVGRVVRATIRPMPGLIQIPKVR